MKIGCHNKCGNNTIVVDGLQTDCPDYLEIEEKTSKSRATRTLMLLENDIHALLSYFVLSVLL